MAFTFRSIAVFSAMLLCSCLWCWMALKVISNRLMVPALEAHDAPDSHDGTSVLNATFHNMQRHSYDILKQEELERWGQHTYMPNRVLCAVPTTWNDSARRIERIQKTWGPRCDILVFAVASEYEIPTNVTVGELLVVNMTRSASPQARNTWEKSHLMLRAVAEKYIDKAEWFLKVDDDTFLFVDHLKGFTQYYNPQIPRYFGHTLLHHWKSLNIVFNAGLAYVMSREGLERVAVKLRNMPRKNKRDIPLVACHDRKGANEDVAMAICLHDVGIKPDNTLDSTGRQRFLPFQLQAHYTHKRDDNASWFWKYKPMITGTEENCCVPPQELIAVHGYKNDGMDAERFFKLHEMALASQNHTPLVPPKPSWFWYDEDMLDFEVDEWRNSLAVNRNRFFSSN